MKTYNNKTLEFGAENTNPTLEFGAENTDPTLEFGAENTDPLAAILAAIVNIEENVKKLTNGMTITRGGQITRPSSESSTPTIVVLPKI